MHELRADPHDQVPGNPTIGTAGHRYAARLCGPFRVSRDDELLNDAAAMGRTSARTLLKWFLLYPDVHVEPLDLCELLWPARIPQRQLNRLHVTLHYLRYLLEPNLAARQPSTFIRSDGKRGYRFNFADCWWTDVMEIDRLLVRARRAEACNDLDKAITLYEQVLGYYSRTFLPENLFDNTFDACRTAHDVTQRDIENRLLRLYAIGGLTHKALPIALSVLERDPYSEEASNAIAEANLLQGNVSAARTRLAAYAETVKRELGVNPSQATARLLERIERVS